MRYRSFLPLALLVVAACSGNRAGRPAHVAPPDIGAGIVSDIFFGSGNTAPATVEVRVRNNSDVPVIVTRIDVESTEMTEWGLLSRQQQYREPIAPKSTEALTFFGTAYTQVARRTEPLVFNVRVELEAEGVRWIEFRRVTSRSAPPF